MTEVAVEIHREGNIDRVRSWATDLEGNTLQQALRSSRCQAVSGPIALMADAHFGLGATVGSVIPTRSAIIPAAVGVDIGCGMIAVRTDMDSRCLPDNLASILAEVGRSIPAGFNRHQHPTKAAQMWSSANKLETDVTLTSKQTRGIAQQLGTLGGGNHFVEISLDESDQVWAVLHSGSRGIGNILARSHIERAKGLCRDLERSLEDRDLAYFLESDDGFQAYIRDMLWAQDYALENREQMMNSVLGVLRSELARPVRELERINCHHNYTTRERHGDQDLWITRKGAIRAGAGDLGIIPGSMGTNSYVVAGLGESSSYHSASHGAGRRFGRKEAKRRFTTDQLDSAMEGRAWQQNKARELLDESPMAYKDIEQVMLNQNDLVEVRHQLRAVMNYKGTT